MRKVFIVVALVVGACSHDNGKPSPVQHVSAMGPTLGIAVDSDEHVAYLLNAPTVMGSRGDLHLAGADGKDTLIASGVSVGGYLLSPRGKGMVFTQLTPSGTDAALFWVDLTNPATPPKQLFAGGMQTTPVNPSAPSSGSYTTPLSQESFLSPSGRYLVVGVLAPKVAVSPDLHVIDMDTGNDVFMRGNGAFDYLELALPDDTMIFQDAVGNNTGPSAPPGVQTLFWVTLGGGGDATTIDTRTGQFTPTGDNKTLVYQKVDTRELWTWDIAGKAATGTKLASGVLGFAVGQSGPVAYIGTDKSLHVVGLDGSTVVTVDGATAKADPFSPVYISSDGADVYYFQAVDTQDAQGTLMHLSAAAGATPSKIADAASLTDVKPIPGGLLFVQNVDSMGTVGDAMKSARDGSGATMIGAGVPVGFLTLLVPPAGGSAWLSPHLSMSSESKTQKLADGARAIVGALELTSPTSDTVVDPAVRLGQFTLSTDLATMAYIGGVAFDGVANNYVGALESVATATPTMKPAMPLLTGVSELGVVSQAKQIFVNAPKAMMPGVYFVKLP